MAVAVDTPTDMATMLRGDPKRMGRERRMNGLLFLTAAFSVVVSALIIYSLVFEAWEFLRQVELAALWEIGWFPRRGLYDVRTIVVGSLIVTGIAMLVALPLGLGAAVYLSEYASPRVRRILKPALEILAGIPSVVLGYFALTWISPNLVQDILGSTSIFSLGAAGIGVGLLVVPLMASISEDAMRSVPNSLREASYGIGARKLTTTLRVVIPAAVSGLVAAFIVSTSRAIGETMVVAIAAGGSGGALFNTDPLQGGQTMTGAMASIATGTDQVAGATLAFQSLFFVGLLLFIITLTLNVIADRFVRRVRQKY